MWELLRRGFDSHHIFSVDEFYWEDRPRYYAALKAVQRGGDDLTWKALGVSKQSTHELLKPLLAAGLIVREGTKRGGHYRLR